MIIVLLLLVLITGYISCAEAIFERDWPRSTIKGFIIALLLLFAGIQAFGQASRYDNIVNTINQSAPQPGGLYPALYIPNSGIAICTSPANAVPCTNYATTYTSATSGVTCTAPTQLTRPNSTTCVAGSDEQGGWGVWMTTGSYQYTITTTYGSFGPYDFSIGGSGGGGGGGSPAPPNFSVQISNTGQTAFAADPNITENTTTHTLTSPRFGHLPTITIPDDTGPSSTVGCTAPVVGDGVTDDWAAVNACALANKSVYLLFRKTQAPNTCDYFFSQPLVMYGGDAQWSGVSGGGGGGTRFCFAADVSGIWASNIKASNAHLHHLVLVGGNHWTNTVLADFIVPQRFGGTGANAVGVIANSNGMTVDHVRGINFANSGLYVMSSDSLGAPVASATGNGTTATVVTTVGHGCANGMAVAVTGISGLTGSSLTTEVDLTFVNSTTVTFPSTYSGSFSGGGAALTCNSFLSTLGLYAVADEGTVSYSYFSNNRGDGIFAMGGDSNDWTFQGNQNLSNQLAGVRELSFLGNAHIREQTDANGWDLTTPGTPVAMTSVSTTNNTLTFTSSDPNLIVNTVAPKQGSQIQVSACFLPGPAAITFAQVIPVGAAFWLQVAIPGFIGGSGSITTSGISLTGSTGGYNFNGTFTGSEFVTNAANSGVPGLEFLLPGYAGAVTTSQAQTANATNYPSVVNGNWFLSTNTGSVWTGRRNPNFPHPNVASVNGCQEAVLPGTQIWATANVDGGGGIYNGAASGNTIFHPYSEADQRAIKCAQLDRFVGGDVGSGYDISCIGSYTQGVRTTTQNLFTPDPNGVIQGNVSTFGGGWSEYDVLKTFEQSCTLLSPSESNSCGLSFGHTLPNPSMTEDWWGFNGGLFASPSISTATAYSLLLGYSQTAENSDGNHPPVWIPNAIYGSQTFGTNHPLVEMTWGTAAPTTGTWTTGSIVWNTNPISNGIAEWVNTVAGTPGTWQPVNYGSGGSSVTWPTTGDVVVSNSTNSPAGIAEVDGECVVGAAGAWGAGACSGSAATAFSAITGSTNTTAAMVVGTGASIAATGSGAITATAVPAAGITGTTLPSGIVTSSLTALGTIATGVWQGTLIGSTHGGTGVNNASTLTLGSSNQNWATLGTGIVKNTTTTGALSNAASADMIALWTGSCSSTTFLRGDGACATPSGSISGLTTGYIPKAGSSTSITSNSAMDDGITTASTITSTEPIVAPSATFTGSGIPISMGTASNTDLGGQLTLSGGTAAYSFTATHTAASRCVATDTTAANAVQVVVTTTTLTINGTSTDVVDYICVGSTP